LSHVPLIAGRPVVHPTYIKMLCVTLRGLGIDVDAALHQAHMPPWAVLVTSDSFLDQDTIHRLIAAALQASGKPWLGIEVGAAVQACDTAQSNTNCFTRRMVWCWPSQSWLTWAHPGHL
jgi:hypothetical protein